MPNAHVVDGVIRKGETVTLSVRFNGWERGDMVGSAYLQGIPTTAEEIVNSSNQRVKKEANASYTYKCDLIGESPLADYIGVEAWAMW